MINCPECNKKMEERIQAEPESTLPAWYEIWLECEECGIVYYGMVYRKGA